ncbi:secreted protein [Gordonia phage Catfish]|uniref:Lipoprotein n=1 Tax=Gordonia phage Catfish TaxID=2301538 RepID=A0A385D1U4_9CAUD|nr:secreted protein [Gordonia phage Catfish]AXQ51891.1 hypothetical protein SEA_CATFISH_55 [Gordonia phage Catfish]
MRKTRSTLAALAIGAAALAGLTGCSNMNEQQHTGCQVLDKERLMTNGSSGEKRVVTSCGVFAVEDSFAGGFNSYDRWNVLEIGKTFDIRTGGYRVGFFSMFPTVIEVESIG